MVPIPEGLLVGAGSLGWIPRPAPSTSVPPSTTTTHPAPTPASLDARSRSALCPSPPTTTTARPTTTTRPPTPTTRASGATTTTVPPYPSGLQVVHGATDGRRAALLVKALGCGDESSDRMGVAVRARSGGWSWVAAFDLSHEEQPWGGRAPRVHVSGDEVTVQTSRDGHTLARSFSVAGSVRVGRPVDLGGTSDACAQSGPVFVCVAEGGLRAHVRGASGTVLLAPKGLAANGRVIGLTAANG